MGEVVTDIEDVEGVFYFSTKLDCGELLTIAPITDATAAEHGIRRKKRFGYFLQLGPSGRRRILAKLRDVDAAADLARLLKMG
jgi:hypothetical protein